MSSLTDVAKPVTLEPLRAKCWWIVALGVVYLIAGFIALGSVVMATVASVFVVGIMMIVAGVAEVINAFQVKTWGKFLLWALLGALYIVAGFVTFENPLLAAALLTLILGIALIASGIIRNHSCFRHEGGDALDLDCHIRRDHAAARTHRRVALAGVQPLYPRDFPWCQPRVCGGRLGRSRPRLAPAGSRLDPSRSGFRIGHGVSQVAG